MVVMVVVVMMPMASNHDHRGTPRMAVVMVMMMVHLSQLHISLRGFGRRLLIQRLQRLCRIRDRLEQVGIGIRGKRVRRAWRGRGLRGTKGAERRHRSQKSSDLLVHKGNPLCR